MKYILSDQNSIANTFIKQIRDVNIQTDRLRFRRNLERLGEIFAYEISKNLNYESCETETPLGISESKIHSDGIVLGTILRAGLPLHQGLLNYFDHASNAFISAYRTHHKDGTFEIQMQYITCPKIDGKVLILADPMLATGASINKALKAILELGTPSQVHIVTAIASAPGVEYVQKEFPDLHLWIGAVDEELTAKSYIVPGLGDAGDLAFGDKIQD